MASTTTAALVSTGMAIIFITRGLLDKAAGKGWHRENDCCALEVGLALEHSQSIVPVIMDESVHEAVGWPGAIGARLAALVRDGVRPAVDICSDDASPDASVEEQAEAAKFAAWKVYHEVRYRARHVPDVASSRLNEAAGTPRVRDATDTTPIDPLEIEGPVEDEDEEEKPQVAKSVSPARLALRERGKAHPQPPNNRDNRQGGRRAAAAAAVSPSAPCSRATSAASRRTRWCCARPPRYGKYAIGFRTAGVDGERLRGMSVYEYGELQIKGEPLRKRLHAAVRRLAARGVPHEATKGSTLSVMWQALRGGYAEPLTDEERFEALVSARQEREKEALTPRSDGMLSLTPRQMKEAREEEIRNAVQPTAADIMFGMPTHSATPYAAGSLDGWRDGLRHGRLRLRHGRRRFGGGAGGIPASVLMKIHEDHRSPRVAPTTAEDAGKDVGSYSLH